MYRKKINVPMPNSQVQFEVDTKGMRVLKFWVFSTQTRRKCLVKGQSSFSKGKSKQVKDFICIPVV